MIKERWEISGDKYMAILQDRIDELVAEEMERLSLQAEMEEEAE